MKIYLHYTIWNKGGHIPWLCEGIRKSFPAGTIVDFVFENCTDGSLQNFLPLIKAPIEQYGTLRDFDVRYYESTKKLRIPNVNDALERFMASDATLFVTPQDDMKIQDAYIVPNLIKLFSEVPDIGIVGGRDGIIKGQFFSSNHSPGGARTQKTTFLKSGEYKQVEQVNDGPLIVSKFSVNTVGYFDRELWAHYHEPEYCWRAEALGLKNFVMGMELVHEKWGCKVCGEIQQSEIWSQEYSTHDYDLYKSKWPHKV